MQNNKKYCLVCNEEIKTNPVEVYGKYSIYQCQNCELQFADPLDYSPEVYNEAFKGADTALKNNNDFYRRSLAVLSIITIDINCLVLTSYQQVVIKWLKGNIPQGAYVFDLGCGAGRFLMALQKEGFCPLGMDVAKEPIKILKEKGFQVAVGTVTNYPSDWPEPGCIVLLEVLEHLPAPVVFLKSIAMRFPKTPLLLSVPSPKRYDRKRDIGDYPPHHFTRWTETSFAIAIERAGYKSKVIFPKVIPGEITGTGVGWLIAKFWRGRGIDNRAREGIVSPALEKRLLYLKKLLYAPLVAYLNLKGYSGHSMVGIGIPEGRELNNK